MQLKFRIHIKSTRKRKPAEELRRQYKKEFQNVLRRIGMKGVNNIRSEIKKRDLIDTGKMYKSVNYKMTPQGVRFIVDSPAPFLEKGIRKHTMKYLLNSKGPIPIQDASTGNLIFRWATKESMARGGWKHPGFKRGKKFMSSSIKRTRTQTATDIQNIAKKVFKD
jgi:hypothetical protein